MHLVLREDKGAKFIIFPRGQPEKIQITVKKPRTRLMELTPEVPNTEKSKV